MPNGYTRSPKLLKGALVELSEPFIGVVPNIIVFQYNPETMSRTLTPWQQPSGEEQGEGQEAKPTVQPFDPAESFDVTLELDVTDALEEPEKHPVAVVSGVADRIAAMERLIYPVDESFLVKEIEKTLKGVFTTVQVVPRFGVPVVLFVWGPGLILPVRLTSFSVEEQAYSPTLYPIRAKVSVGLRVLPPHTFEKIGKKLSMIEEIAIAVYHYTHGQRKGLAAANVANSVESILGMLPF